MQNTSLGKITLGAYENVFQMEYTPLNEKGTKQNQNKPMETTTTELTYPVTYLQWRLFLISIPQDSSRIQFSNFRICFDPISFLVPKFRFSRRAFCFRVRAPLSDPRVCLSVVGFCRPERQKA